MTTADPRATARAMREAGQPYTKIASTLGVATATVFRWLHPERTAAQNAAIRSRRVAAGDLAHAVSAPTRAEIARRLAEIPDDTRTLTARLVGDPLPGRSALDRRPA